METIDDDDDDVLVATRKILVENWRFVLKFQEQKTIILAFKLMKPGCSSSTYAPLKQRAHGETPLTEAWIFSADTLATNRFPQFSLPVLPCRYPRPVHRIR